MGCQSEVADLYLDSFAITNGDQDVVILQVVVEEAPLVELLQRHDDILLDADVLSQLHGLPQFQ